MHTETPNVMTYLAKRKQLKGGERVKILVTGGAGFIGSHIVDKLIREKFKVVNVDNFSTGKRKNVNQQARTYNCDITNSKEMNQVFETEKPDIVIHHAAQISIQHSLNAPEFDATVNIVGTLVLLQCCVRHNVKKIIYASSAAVYGDPLYLPVNEEHQLNLLSPYGISKHTPEHYICMFKELYGLDYTILRYSNAYGPRQDAQGEGGVVSIFIDRILLEEPVVIYGDGYQTRDFIYVEDIAIANLAALEKGSNEIINISTNSQTSIKDLLNILCDLDGLYIDSDYQPTRQGDIKHSYLDNNKALLKLDWYPKYSLIEGLNRTLSYYKAEQNMVTILAK